MKKIIAMAIMAIVIFTTVQEVSFLPCTVVDMTEGQFIVAETQEEVIICLHGARQGYVLGIDGERHHDVQDYLKEVAAGYGMADKRIRYNCCYSARMQTGEATPVLASDDLTFAEPVAGGLLVVSTRLHSLKDEAIKNILVANTKVFGFGKAGQVLPRLLR
jgi:hypothetical protein